MHRPPSVVTGVLPAVLLCCASPAQRPAPDAAATPAPYELPKDPAAVVLSLDFQGGFTPERKVDASWLSVQADGTVTVRDLYGLADRPASTRRLDAAALQALLRFVLDEQQLGDWDAAAVQAAVRAQAAAGAPLPAVEDAATTVVKVALPGHGVTAEQYALSIVAPHAPKIAALQRLLAVENRLQHVAAVTVVGGPGRAEAFRAAANTALRAKFADRQPFAVAELANAMRGRGGEVTAWFARDRVAADGGRVRLWASVAMPADPDRAPDVEVAEQPVPF